MPNALSMHIVECHSISSTLSYISKKNIFTTKTYSLTFFKKYCSSTCFYFFYYILFYTMSVPIISRQLQIQGAFLSKIQGQKLSHNPIQFLLLITSFEENIKSKGKLLLVIPKLDINLLVLLKRRTILQKILGLYFTRKKFLKLVILQKTFNLLKSSRSYLKSIVDEVHSPQQINCTNFFYSK